MELAAPGPSRVRLGVAPCCAAEIGRALFGGVKCRWLGLGGRGAPVGSLAGRRVQMCRMAVAPADYTEIRSRTRGPSAVFTPIQLRHRLPSSRQLYLSALSTPMDLGIKLWVICLELGLMVQGRGRPPYPRTPKEHRGSAIQYLIHVGAFVVSTLNPSMELANILP